MLQAVLIDTFRLRLGGLLEITHIDTNNRVVLCHLYGNSMLSDSSTAAVNSHNHAAAPGSAGAVKTVRPTR